MAGFRGGYGPFHDAVAELVARGVFDAGEVSTVAPAVRAATKVGFRDEYEIRFPDGAYPACNYRVDGRTLTVASDDISGLYVERFELPDTIPYDITGICKLTICTTGGTYANIQTGNPDTGHQRTYRVSRGNGTAGHQVCTPTPAPRTDAFPGTSAGDIKPPRRYKLSAGYKAIR